ncbi:S8 family serine peptidase [Streptomyces sp. NPDC051310]|uniref:S8 family serine peptidase n=1 Tax=Streptomyces sp. NPDC051310 TaxID=3365649 RepID=UPI0037978E67
MPEDVLRQDVRLRASAKADWGLRRRHPHRARVRPSRDPTSSRSSTRTREWLAPPALGIGLASATKAADTARECTTEYPLATWLEQPQQQQSVGARWARWRPTAHAAAARPGGPTRAGSSPSTRSRCLNAPGETRRSSAAGRPAGGEAAGGTGATALASASAALIWSLHPDWTAAQVLRVMFDTAGRSDNWKPGTRSRYLGYGTIRPGAHINRGLGNPGPADRNTAAPRYARSTSFLLRSPVPLHQNRHRQGRTRRRPPVRAPHRRLR